MTKISPQYFHSSDGTQLAYREIGQGRPLILFHGYMGSGQQTWVDSGCAAKLAALPRRVILPDLRGHGDSDRPQDAAAYPPDILADDGFALLEQLGIDDYDIAGYSLGARVTLRMLARGAKSRRAVLGGQGLEILSHTPDRMSGYRHLLSNFGRAESGSQDWATENWIRKTGGDPVAYLHILDTFVDTPREILRQISVPTLVMAGVEDTERASADQLAALLPNGRYQAVPGNHISALTNPQFIATMLDFLEAVP